jgi:hypothetical protein
MRCPIRGRFPQVSPPFVLTIASKISPPKSTTALAEIYHFSAENGCFPVDGNRPQGLSIRACG